MEHENIKELVKIVGAFEDGEYKLYVEKYKVHSHTPKGFWLTYGYVYDSKDKWVSNHGKKRFAYPTKEAALVNFIARKKMQIGWNNKRMEDLRLCNIKVRGALRVAMLKDVELNDIPTGKYINTFK